MAEHYAKAWLWEGKVDWDTGHQATNKKKILLSSVFLLSVLWTASTQDISRILYVYTQKVVGVPLLYVPFPLSKMPFSYLDITFYSYFVRAKMFTSSVRPSLCGE